MARIRTIKPEFWTNEKVVACSLRARLLFIALWNFADDAGRLADVPKTIKMQAFAGDDITTDDTHGALTELSVNDLIIRYVVDDKAFIQVKGWHHQKINRPVASKIPPVPNGHSLRPHGVLTERSSIFLPEGKGRDNSEGKGVALTENSLSQSDDHQATLSGDRVVDLLHRACAVAGMPQRRAVNELATGQRWLSLGLTDDQIIAGIETVTKREGYKTPRTLAYFTQAITDHAAALKAGTARAAPTQITDAEHIARTHEFADDMVRMFKSDGRWRGAGPAPDQSGCIVDGAILNRHGYAATTEAA